MDYNEAMKYINETNKFGSKLGIENISVLMDILGNPQEKLKFIHIAGTNGKGSTSTMTSYCLVENGYKTGLYISPFIEKFNERIQLNNKAISDEDLIYNINKVKKAVDKMISLGYSSPTEFEIITAVAFCYFYEKQVDIVVLEVGLGGRLDATNVIKKSLLSVITSISLDHTEHLGEEIPEIAYEKAGIIKENGCVVCYPSSREAIDVIKKEAKKKNASFYEVGKEDVFIKQMNIDYTLLEYKEKNSLGISRFKLALLGKHQCYNVSLVIKIMEILKVKGFNITGENVVRALEKVKFPCRFEILNKKPYIILDGGHNIDGVSSFCENLEIYFKDKKINLFFGMLKDKDVLECFDKLRKYAKKVITLSPFSARAYDGKLLCEKIKNNYNIDVFYLENIEDIESEIDFYKKDEIYVFVGSLYMVGGLRGKLRAIIKNRL